MGADDSQPHTLLPFQLWPRRGFPVAALGLSEDLHKITWK